MPSAKADRRKVVASRIPPYVLNADHQTPSRELQRIITKETSVLDGFRAGDGIYFYGESPSGKTMAAGWLAKRCLVQNIGVLWHTTDSLVRRRDQDWDDILLTEVLVLDPLAEAHILSKEDIRTMYWLLEERMALFRAVVLCSRMEPSDLTDVFGVGLVKKMERHMQFVKCGFDKKQTQCAIQRF